MKNKIRFIAIFAFLAVALTALSIFFQTKLTLSIPKATVYCATKTISIGDKITGSDLQPIQIDLTQKTADDITEISQVENTVAKQQIYKGEIVNSNRLISKSDPSYFATGNNHRFTIPTTYIDDPYYSTFKQGDVVDVYFTPTTNNNISSKAKPVLTHVTVIGAVDSDENIITSTASSKATAILFQSSISKILNINDYKNKGKFSFSMYPLGK